MSVDPSPPMTAWSSAPLISYPMPDIVKTQPPERSWKIHPSRAVLLVHDMQHYFLRRFSPKEDPAQSLLVNVARLVSLARERSIQIAYTAQPGGMSAADRGLLADFWGPGMRMNDGDRGIVSSIEPREEDWLLAKWRYSAFFRTDLLNRLRDKQKTQLVVTGVYGHVGILTTSIEAYSHDIETFVIGDAIADFSASDHATTLNLAGQVCAAILDTNDVVRQLGA